MRIHRVKRGKIFLTNSENKIGLESWNIKLNWKNKKLEMSLSPVTMTLKYPRVLPLPRQRRVSVNFAGQRTASGR